MMTVPQKKYFCKRIDEITTKKVSELKDATGLSNKAIAQMGIANGKIKYPDDIKKVHKAIDLVLGDGKDVHWGGVGLGDLPIQSMIKGFDDYKRELEQEQAEENSKIVNQRNKLYEEATRIKDVAMFGSEEAAHAMLKDFIEWQVG